MELNYDCLRDVLLDLEGLLQMPPGDEVKMPRYTLTHVCKGVNLDQYTKQEVFYAIHNLKQAGYVDAYVEFAGDTLMQCVVSDITYNGHMFLKSVRDNKAWGKIKSAVKQVGGVSLPVLLEIAKDIALHSLGIGG